LASLAVLAILIVLTLVLNRTLQNVALATLVGFGVWYFVNEIYLNNMLGFGYKPMLKDLFLIVIILIIFTGSSLVSASIIVQLLVYLVVVAAVVFVFLRKEIIELVSVVNFIRREKRNYG
jgi:hypothetical protein